MKHLLAILSLFSVLGCSTYRHFENPVIRQGWADPTAIYDNATGYYYSISTGINKPFFRSKNLYLWEKTDIKPYSDSAIRKMKNSGPHIWAPQFAKIGNNYLIYVTVRSSAEDSRIIVLSSKTLTGPYEFANILTDSRETGIKDTIDPFVFTDPRTGKVWMTFGSIGGIHQVELSPDGLSLAKNAEYKHIAGQDIDNDKSRLTVFEGSYVYERNGWWYLFASAGRYEDYSYAIVVGRSRKADGPFLTKEGKDMAEGYGTAILSSSPYDRFYGPGHNGEIFTTKNGETYMIYHVHEGDYREDRNKRKSSPRMMNLQQIYWDDNDWPFFKHDEISGGRIRIR